MKYNVFEPKDELPFVAKFRNRLLKYSIFDDEARIAYDWLCVCIDNAHNGCMDYEIVRYANKIIHYIEIGYRVDIDSNQFFVKYRPDDLVCIIASRHNDSRIIFLKQDAYRRVRSRFGKLLSKERNINEDTTQQLRKNWIDAQKGKHKHTMVPIFTNLPMALDKTFVSICRCSECGYTEKYTMNLINGIFTLEEIKC